MKQIDTKNVGSLTNVWTYKASGYGAPSFGNSLKSTPLMVNGVLYLTMPENVWAVDARTGREIWHYKSPPTPGFHIGQRGVAMWGDWLYFETPNCNLVSLNAKDGKERWRQPIADPKLEYFCTMSPLIIGNHVVDGVGAIHSISPATCNRMIRKPAHCSGSGTPSPSPANQGAKAGPMPIPWRMVGE